MIRSTDVAAPGWTRDARALPQPRAPLHGDPPAPPTDDPAADARARLILRLAADRLRELQDDGVTFRYIAHLYDTDVASLEQLYRDLVTPRLR